MKNTLFVIGVCFYCFLISCSDESDTSEDKDINPRIPQKEDHEFYEDSVYIISKKIDTVYSFGQWFDLEHVRLKKHLDSLHRETNPKNTN